MKKAYKKLAVVLLTVAAVAMVEARTRDNNDDDYNNSDLYQPESPWPVASAEDLTVGFVGLASGNHAGDASGLAVAVPDAIPGVSYARRKKDNQQDSGRRHRRQQRRHTAGQSNDDGMNDQ